MTCPERALRKGMELDDAEFEALKQWVTTPIDAATGKKSRLLRTTG